MKFSNYSEFRIGIWISKILELELDDNIWFQKNSEIFWKNFKFDPICPISIFSML